MFMWLSLVACIILYTIMIGFIARFQRYLMYHPIKSISPPDVYGLKNIEEYIVQSSDGIKLQLWMHKASDTYPTIIYFHGNAFHLGDRAAKFSAFADRGFGLVSISYRGFGKSEGRPSETGVYTDARASIDYALNTLHIPQNKLIYFGESLGSGVAVQMAMERAPGLLVLEAAYTSVETRSAELYPYVLGVRKLVMDKYDSLAKISKVHAPLLMLHGEKDITIPIRHGRMLFAAANEPKTFIAYPEVHHADYTNEQILLPLMDAARNANLL
jgi:fermentation-respiration switch protein FrsA (DUF1100 family)